MSYELFLFDLDDTLFDFGETEKHALTRTFNEFDMPNGVADYRESYKAISGVLWRDLEEGSMSIAQLKVERFKRLFAQHQLHTDAVKFSEQYIANLGMESHVLPGVEDMLEALSSKRLAILTNGFTLAQNARVEKSGLRHYFDAIISSEETGFQKPQKEIFDYTLAKLGVSDRSKVLMVGDSLTSDIKGGILSGIDTCWYNPSYKNNETALQPTYEVSSWEAFSKQFSEQHTQISY